jgi:hypothetical protein
MIGSERHSPGRRVVGIVQLYVHISRVRQSGQSLGCLDGRSEHVLAQGSVHEALWYGHSP